MYGYSELDDDFDTCGDCVKCGREVHEAGSHICDDCDPDRQIDQWHAIDDGIEF